MRKVFWENPYLCTLDTEVVMTNADQVEFKETIIFSESGGQESDNAVVNGMPVLNSRMSEDRKIIIYTLPLDHGLKKGDKVRMEIDWARRNRLMRLHFCCELVLVLVNRILGNKPEGEELKPEEIDVIGPFKTGAHMSATGARVDFAIDDMRPHIPALLSAFNKVIEADLPIETGYIDEAKQERYWRVKGLATVPCGGTHVASTAEVGYANLKREKNGKATIMSPNGPKRVTSERIRISLKDPITSSNK